MFLDFPLGHTTGRVHDPNFNRAVVEAALDALANDQPGHITDLPYHWAETDAWKDDVMRVDISASGAKTTRDDRVERVDTPQYQRESDAAAATASHEGKTCLVCGGIDY